jgi:hypothetical protein
MNLCTFWPVAALAVAALSACGTPAGSTTPTPGGATDAATTDAPKTNTDAAAGDAKDGSGTALDAAADGAGKTDASADGVDPNKECCQKAGATCGFTAKCPAKCGDCAQGETCKANKCEKGPPPVQKKKFGETCGPSKDCVPPPQGAAQTEQQAYFDCLNAQCEGAWCWESICTKPCTIQKDAKINHSGENGTDYIEDPDQPSDCEGALESGPAGKAFKCTEIRSEAQLASGASSLQICQPGTTFKPCEGDTDCPTGETCGYKYYGGAYRVVCTPKFTNGAGKPGATFAKACNEDPTKGDWNLCANNSCLGSACHGFCKNDNDCISAPGVCKGGKCDGSGGECKNDTDCSAYKCELTAFFGPNAPKVKNCQRKKCLLDGDCKDSNYYCRPFSNGVKSEDGDPDPVDPKSLIQPAWDSVCWRKPETKYAKPGELCDDFPNDTDKTLPECQSWMCLDGICSTLCKADKDCPSNMKCRILEIPFDTSTPQDKINDYSLPLQVCVNATESKGPCWSSKECKDGASTQCVLNETQIELPGATTADAPTIAYGITGQCIKPEASFVNFGEACGQNVGKNCKSAMCWGSQTAGYFCREPCDGKDACPPAVTVDGKERKTYCTAGLAGWGGKVHDPNEFVYIPYCQFLATEHTLADCSKNKKCADANEVCTPIAIAWGKDKAAKVEYRCTIGTAPGQPKPTKKVGESCNPQPKQDDPAECVFACLGDDTAGKGYCSILCGSNADCGSNDGMYCDLEHQWLPRADASKAPIVPICKKKKACTPCDWHNDCAGGYSCTNLGGADKNFKGRCAQNCKTDDDCGAGGVCEAAKNWKGADFKNGLKVCKPACK